jgi:hypothetical protein
VVIIFVDSHGARPFTCSTKLHLLHYQPRFRSSAPAAHPR